MRQRWREMDANFDNQAANAATKARIRSEERNSEKQLEKHTLSSHQPIAELTNTKNQLNSKAVITVDFAITQAGEQKTIETPKQKWITRQSLLTDALTHSLAETTIDEVKTEFIKREKNGELKEFDLDRHGMRNHSKLEKVSVEEAQVAHFEISETNLTINHKSGKLDKTIENKYDETRTLQSEIGANRSRRKIEIHADHSDGNNERSLTSGTKSQDRRNPLESNIAGLDADDASAHSNKFVRPDRLFKSDSEQFGENLEQNNRNFWSGDQESQSHDSAFGGGKRELPNRSGNSENGTFNDKRNSERITNECKIKGKAASRSLEQPTLFDEKNAFKQESDFQTAIAQMETTPRIESSSDLAEVQIDGAKSAAFRSNRTDDKSTGSREIITGNDTKNFSTNKGNGAENKNGDSKSERGIIGDEERNDTVERKHQTIEHTGETSRTEDGSRRTINGRDEQEVSNFSNRNGESQITIGERFKGEGLVNTRIPNRTQYTAATGDSSSAKSDNKIEQENRFDSGTNTGSERVGNFKGTESGEKSAEDGSCVEIFDRAADFNSSSGGLLFLDKRRFEQETDNGEDYNRAIKSTTEKNSSREKSERTEFDRHNSYAATNIPSGRKSFQPAAGKTAEVHPNSIETNRRTAEKTAQVINITRFSGSLEPQIVAEWTAIIEKSNAAEFLSEVAKPKSCDEEQQLFEQLDLQSVLIAEKLNLPKPQPEIKTNNLKLAIALTQIEVVNYEKTSGVPLDDKVREVLVENKLRHAAEKPLPEQIELLHKSLGDTLETSLNLATALEVKTLNALLDPDKQNLDAAEVLRAQQYVEINKTAAQETATLVQIAYGGQINKFTDNFKDDLAEQLYYAPTPAIDTYRNFRQFDWQQTVENFAPTVNYLAEQYKIEIKPPDNDLEKNRMLADFVARQLIETYESQKSSLTKYVQNEFVNSFMRAGNLEIHQTQKDLIAAQTDQNLNPPEFSRNLEASAYNITKFDEDKKMSKAIEITDQIRKAAQIREEKLAALEIQETQVLIMR